LELPEVITKRDMAGGCLESRGRRQAGQVAKDKIHGMVVDDSSISGRSTPSLYIPPSPKKKAKHRHRDDKNGSRTDKKHYSDTKKHTDASGGGDGSRRKKIRKDQDHHHSRDPSLVKHRMAIVDDSDAEYEPAIKSKKLDHHHRPTDKLSSPSSSLTDKGHKKSSSNTLQTVKHKSQEHAKKKTVSFAPSLLEGFKNKGNHTTMDSKEKKKKYDGVGIVKSGKGLHTGCSSMPSASTIAASLGSVVATSSAKLPSSTIAPADAFPAAPKHNPYVEAALATYQKMVSSGSLACPSPLPLP